MKIPHHSSFKDPAADITAFEKWVARLEHHNQRTYERYTLETSLGKTHVWGLNTKNTEGETLVIFPGARTTALIWDFDKGLDNLGSPLRIFMVETNGLPNLSDGDTPDIHTLEYGVWAGEVLDQLSIDKAYIAGASFGGLICMKLALVRPEKIKAAFLLNPGCLQPFSLKLQNLYYNLLPLFSPSPANVQKFLDKAVFHKPNHRVSAYAEELIIDYEVLAISRYRDKTQKPYYMDKQLEEVKVDTYLLLGDKDLLFPYQKSMDNAKRQISSLKEVRVFPNIAHGIETYDKALQHVASIIHNRPAA